MTNNFDDIIGQAEQNKQFNMPPVDFTQYPLLECDKCKSNAFTTAIAIRKVPGIVLGEGDKDQYIPVQILVCAKCGEIFVEDRKHLKIGEFKDDNTASSLQI